jgi:hypothetical protein
MGHGGKRNNAGRKTIIEEHRIKDLTSPYVVDAINVIIQIMQTAEKETDKLSAAKLLLAYHFGQPSQQMDITTQGEPITKYTIEIIDGKHPGDKDISAE